MALHFFVDEIKRKRFPTIVNRRTDLSAVALSYAGLILVTQKSGYDKERKQPKYPARVSAITKRGMAFWMYLNDVEPLKELIKKTPYPFDRPKG